jgi:hypothetical protein
MENPHAGILSGSGTEDYFWIVPMVLKLNSLHPPPDYSRPALRDVLMGSLRGPRRAWASLVCVARCPRLFAQSGAAWKGPRLFDSSYARFATLRLKNHL